MDDYSFKFGKEHNRIKIYDNQTNAVIAVAQFITDDRFRIEIFEEYQDQAEQIGAALRKFLYPPITGIQWGAAILNYSQAAASRATISGKALGMGVW